MIIRSALRAAGSTSALVAIYYLLPLDTSITWAAITILAVWLIVLIVMVAFQVRWILTSPFPGLRAIEALATSVPLFLLLFASAYVVMAKISGSNFSEPLSRTDALYFTVTVFSTVGFGDITAKSQAARRVVTAQIIADLVILGLAIKAIVGARTTTQVGPAVTPGGAREGIVAGGASQPRAGISDSPGTTLGTAVPCAAGPGPASGGATGPRRCALSNTRTCAHGFGGRYLTRVLPGDWCSLGSLRVHGGRSRHRTTNMCGLESRDEAAAGAQSGGIGNLQGRVDHAAAQYRARQLGGGAA